jgi:hypothetical protein
MPVRLIQRHRAARTGWMRAALLGANDGAALTEPAAGEHLTRRLNRLWIHMTTRIRFNIPTGTKGPVMNGEALF